MTVELIITVALAAAIIVIILTLVLMVVFLRWRISDLTVHLEKFIKENLMLQAKLRQYHNID